MMNYARNCSSLTKLILLLILAVSSYGFTNLSAASYGQNKKYTSCRNRYLFATTENNNNNNNKNPVSGFFDMFANFDDVIDDFFYKRMGKGEVFYGKRKYKPSGEVEGNYNGFGLSDKGKIDFVRDVKAERDEERTFRAELAKIQREREQRNN